jgi:hypothetical protein
MLPTFDTWVLFRYCKSPSESLVDTCECTMVDNWVDGDAESVSCTQRRVLLLVASKTNVACLVCYFDHGRFAVVPADRQLPKSCDRLVCPQTRCRPWQTQRLRYYPETIRSA